MEKYKVDYSDLSHFKGITIYFDYLEEGFAYVKKHRIKDIFVRAEDICDKKQMVNFDFLKEYTFIETFHWIIPLKKKSDITGIYHLTKLRNLRWSPDQDFSFNLAAFPLLEKINMGYSSKIEGWDNLPHLKTLMMGSVKTDDLLFLQYLTNLEYLRLIGGKFTSISGIENLSKLETLFLQSCTSLTQLKPTIEKLTSLKQLNLERCKKVDVKKNWRE